MFLIIVIMGIISLGMGIYFWINKNERQFTLISFVITVISFILLPFASQISFHGNADKVTEQNSEKHDESDENIFIPDSGENIGNNENDETINDETVNDESEIEAAEYENKDGFSGSITYEDQENDYQYYASRTGMYHFDFDISDVNNYFSFYMSDSVGNAIVDTYGYPDSGCSVYLEAGQAYDIQIQECNGLLDYYHVNIGIPNEEQTVTDNLIEGAITYKDQEDTYYYEAPVSGVYRLDFDVSDVNCPFNVNVWDSKNKGIGEGVSSNEGITVEFDKGEIYTIVVSEYEGLLEKYQVSINVPNEPVTVTSKSFSGKIRYEDQEDTYYYTAPRKGVYRFDFDVSDVNSGLQFFLYDSKNDVLVDGVSCEHGATVDLDKGKKYRIVVEQYEGLQKWYKGKIGVPLKTKKITSFPVKGTLKYKDQCNIYTFVPTRTGEYTFHCGINNIDAIYYFTIIDTTDQSTICETSSNHDETVELVRNRKYRILIEQDEGINIKYTISL